MQIAGKTTKTTRCYTTFKEKVIDEDEALAIYLTLKDSIEWEEEIRSKKGFTRKAKTVPMGQYPEIDSVIIRALRYLITCKESKNPKKYAILNYYLNYYEDGNMWTPNHSHRGTHQMVLSLGATRTLTVGKKEFQMSSGSAILFGGSIHGVPKNKAVKEGRISIATFMVPVE